MRFSTKDLLVLGGIGLGAAWLGQQAIRRSRWISFEGRTAIVVGGSRGLGLIIARKLADARAHVAICARTEEDVEAAVRDLRERGGSALGVACDIRNQGEVISFVDQVVAKWGAVDALFNVAGVMQVGPPEPLIPISEAG